MQKNLNKYSKSQLPITLRGILLLSIAIYLLFGPVRYSSDIIAAAFSFCVLASMSFFVGIAFFTTRRLNKNLKVSFSSKSDAKDTQFTSKDYAQQEINFLTKLSGLNIPSFFEIRLQLAFLQPEIKPLIHLLTTSSPKELFLIDTLVFPHRGNWQIQGVSLELRDRLGLTKFTLPFIALSSDLKIEPQESHSPRWPVQASTIRIDDQISHLNERKGDLYDIKQYHPSDGSRKIVWKLLAKSGQLFSRNPEPAYSPEGKVVFICLAQKQDDKLCAESLAYLSELEKLDIEIIFSDLSNNPRIATTESAAREMLIADAWNSELADSSFALQSLRLAIEAAKGANSERIVQNVILAISENSLQSKKYQEIITACQNELQQNAINVNLFISSNLEDSSKLKISQSPQIIRAMKNILLEQPATYVSKEALENSKNFLANLKSKSSEVAWS